MDFLDVPAFGAEGLFRTAKQVERSVSEHKKEVKRAEAAAAKVALAKAAAPKKGPKRAREAEAADGGRKKPRAAAAAVEAPVPSGKNLGRRRRAHEKRERLRAERAGAEGEAAVARRPKPKGGEAAEPRRPKKARAAPAPAAPVPPPADERALLKAQRRAQLAEARAAQRAGGQEAGGEEPAAATAAAPRAKAAKPTLLQRAQAQLAGGRFRWLNQELYQRDGGSALALMAAQPQLFAEYHAGFRSQTAGWPRQPLDECIAWLRRSPAAWVVADIGCGDARLAASVPQRVHSFDLVAASPAVTACDMCALPLGDGALDAAVFCLSLMGTDYGRALGEARRALRAGGALWLAEVRSRFAGAEGGSRAFLRALAAAGFALKETDESDTMFVVYRLVKTEAPPGRPDWPQLKVCEYKKR